MDKTSFKSVDAYIASQPEAVQPTLEQVRAAIRKAAPDAAEAISYQMPAYKAPGGTLIYFAGWKSHYAIYPVSAAIAAEFKADLAPYEVSKGTIRFPLDEPVPADLIARITAFRLREIAEKAATKTGR